MPHVPRSAVGLKPSIIGRRAQLAALAQALRQLEDRGSPIVALSGEPGIGKTRLVDELCARADGHGHLVLRGRAAEMEQDLPFAVVVDALGDFTTWPRSSSARARIAYSHARRPGSTCTNSGLGNGHTSGHAELGEHLAQVALDVGRERDRED